MITKQQLIGTRISAIQSIHSTPASIEIAGQTLTVSAIACLTCDGNADGIYRLETESPHPPLTHYAPGCSTCRNKVTRSIGFDYYAQALLLAILDQRMANLTREKAS